MGLHGIPMGNMSNHQLMQMQLHGMDLQRMGMGLPGLCQSPNGLCFTQSMLAQFAQLQCMTCICCSRDLTKHTALDVSVFWWRSKLNSGNSAVQQLSSGDSEAIQKSCRHDQMGQHVEDDALLTWLASCCFQVQTTWGVLAWLPQPAVLVCTWGWEWQLVQVPLCSRYSYTHVALLYNTVKCDAEVRCPLDILCWQLCQKLLGDAGAGSHGYAWDGWFEPIWQFQHAYAQHFT